MSRCLLVCVSLLAGCSEYGFDRKVAPVVEDPTTSPPAPPPPAETEPPETSTTPDLPVAEAPMYAHSSTALFELDAQDLDAKRVGPFERADGTPIEGMVDIAIDLDGRMFGTTEDALYRIDPSTATVQRACGMSVEAVALAFTSDGVLFAGTYDRIVTVDPEDCTLEVLVDRSPYTTSGDLVGLPDGYLYWAVEGRSSDELVRVDPDDGNTREIGVIGSRELYGLGYDQGELYGFSAEGTILAIAPATGEGIEVVADGPSWWGATTNPVVW